jgi:hypothetical protein
MTNEVDQRERRVLERGLRELGYDPAEFAIEIAELPPNPRSRSLPNGVMPRRKAVVVTRAPTGETFRLEAYVEGAWAGEVVQAVLGGLLGAKAGDAA